MSAPSVLFLPGFMQHADAWSDVAAAVGERYPVKVLDFETWTFEERVAEIASAAEPDDVVVGYSMGGRLALHAALADAGGDGTDPAGNGADGARVPLAGIAALVLIGVSAGIEDPAARAERARADAELADWIDQHSIEEVVDRWERNPVFGTQSAELVAAQRPGRLRHQPRSLARLLRSAGQGALAPVWDRLGSLQVPVVAVAGAHDVGYAAAAERIASAVPRGEARVVPGAGHAVHLEAPDAVVGVIFEVVERFWAL